jgi:hypothetical protein
MPPIAEYPDPRVESMIGSSLIHWCRSLVSLGRVLAICVIATGCHSANRPLRANIQSPDSSERILAIKAAADSGDKTAVPLIVDRLEDEDQGVQFFAILSLEKLTGKRLGYEISQPPAQRVAAIERWRTFVEQGEHKLSMNKQEGSAVGGGADVNASPNEVASKGSLAIPGN